MANEPKVLKQALYTMLRDLKAVYTDTWFLPADSFASQADAWYKVLKDISADYLRGAFDEWIRTSPKPPAPSQIREIAIRLMRGTAEGDSSPLDDFILWGVFDRKTGKRVCQDILADRKFSNVDILKEVTAKVGDGDYTVRRIG